MDWHPAETAPLGALVQVAIAPSAVRFHKGSGRTATLATRYSDGSWSEELVFAWRIVDTFKDSDVLGWQPFPEPPAERVSHGPAVGARLGEG